MRTTKIWLYHVFAFDLGRYGNKTEKEDNPNQPDVSPGDEGCADMTSSCISGNSIE